MKKYIILIFIITLSFYNCSKDKVEMPEPSEPPFIEECQDVPPASGIILGNSHTWTAIYPVYDKPRFNPNNADEIILRLRKERLVSAFQLVKYNLVTKEQETIYEGDFATPRWSKKDWIIIPQSDFNLYKIKSNGDSLIQLTTSGQCFGPEWNITGDKFIFGSLQSGTPSVICDEFGIPLDTIAGSTVSPSWQHDSLITNAGPAWLFTRNPANSDLDFKVITEIDDGGTTTAEWLDNENIVWASHRGISKVNITTKETEILIESCNSKVYQYPTVSKISKKIIFQRIDKEVTDLENNKGIISCKIFMMNFDGSEKEELDLSL